jgi:putative DNA primase/helicase
MAEFTDTWAAKEFAKENEWKARWIPKWKSWIVWNGKFWEADESGEVLKLAGEWVQRQGNREIRMEALKKEEKKYNERLWNWMVAGEGLGKQEAMVNLARSRMMTRVEELDSNLWLLNCENKTVDLKNFVLLEHDPKHLITKICHTNVVDETECPLWESFLLRAMGGKMDLVDYIQKVVGSGLCGEVLDKAIYFANGDGDTGKTTFVTTCQKVLGEDYTTQIKYQDFMMDKFGEGGRVTPELEHIEGKRFVVSSEGEQGQKLSTAKIKQLTGMGKITVNPKYRREYSFIPQATFIFDTNYFPEVDGTDQALFNRIKILPFNVIIPVEEQNPNLKNEFLEEGEGILRWMIEGCRRWQEETLRNEPEEVRIATKKEQTEADPVGRWIDECLDGVAGSEISTSDCQNHYNAWAKDAGQVEIEKAKTFKRRMEKPARKLNGLEIERVTKMYSKNSGGYKNIRFKINLDLEEEGARSEVEKTYKQGKMEFGDDL